MSETNETGEPTGQASEQPTPANGQEKPKRPRRGRGEGSIDILPSGKFRVTVSCGIGPDNKRRRVTKSFDTKKEATIFREEMLNGQRRGVVVYAGNMRLADWLDKWTEAKRATVEPGTLVFYERTLARALKPIISPTLLIGRLTRMDVEGIQSAIAATGASNDAIRKAMGMLSSALKSAVEQGILSRNPASGVPRPKHERGEVKPWNVEQVKAFLAVAKSHRLHALFALALDTGMRPGELLALHWPEVDLDARRVKVERSLEQIDKKNRDRWRLKAPKSRKSRRTVSIAPSTVAVLQAHRERMRAEERDVVAGKVFPNTDGGWISKDTLWRIIAKLTKRAGVPMLRPHGLRHTNATLLLQAGVNIRLISERLGHEDISTTLRLYAHILDADQGVAAGTVERLFYDSLTIASQPPPNDACSPESERPQG